MLSGYSFSSLDTYHVCPRKFKYVYVDRVRAVPTVMADTYLGSAVHRVLRLLYELGADGILLSREDAVKEYLKQWEKLDRDQITVESEYYTVDDYIRIGQDMLVRHWERFKPFNKGTLLGAELNLTFQLPGTPFNFKCYVDRLWRREDDTVEICDYKTGQHLAQPSDRRFFYQMGIYQLAVQTHYPQCNEIEVAQYYLRRDTIVNHRLRPDELDLLNEQLRLAVVETIQASRNDNFPAREGNHCSYCGFQQMCPAKAHRHLLEQEESAENQGQDSAQTLKEITDEFLSKYAQEKRVSAELEGLREKLVEAAKRHGMSRLDGNLGKVTVSVSRGGEFVTKTSDGEAFAELSALARQLGLEEYFKLDTRSLLKEVYHKQRLPEDQLKRLEEFMVDRERERVTPRLKAGVEIEDEEP